LKNSAATRRNTTADNESPDILPSDNRDAIREEAAAAGVPPDRLRLRIRPYRGTVIRVAKGPGGVRLSLHSALAAAPEEVLRAALRCIFRRLRRQTPAEGDRRRLAEFCRELAAAPSAEAAPRRRTALCAQGRFVDLEALFAHVNTEHFGGRMQPAAIGWTRGASRSRLAYCRPERGEILVSRLLDRPDIPVWFLEFLLYHEALHFLLPPARTGRRLNWHHRQFREMERAFPHYEAAERLKARLPRLLARKIK
jgi:hypothetical protein